MHLSVLSPGMAIRGSQKKALVGPQAPKSIMAGNRHQKRVKTKATAEELDKPVSPCTWEGRDRRVSASVRLA